MMKQPPDHGKLFFPIGDLHIRTLDEAQIFADYLNQRPERWIILLGDVPHFANSLWNHNIMDGGKAALMRGLEEDIRIWEDFMSRLKVDTIYYLGTHETFAIPIILKELPTLELNVTSEHIIIPRDFETIALDESELNPLYVTGLTIPANVHPINSEKFNSIKTKIEQYIANKIEGKKIPNFSHTIFCTHDPCDVRYRNMGYHALTSLLEESQFKIHYHAHIHSNIRDTVAKSTETVNRSFIALSKLKSEALEPTTGEIRSMFKRIL
jgi:hypothetical protein